MTENPARPNLDFAAEAEEWVETLERILGDPAEPPPVRINEMFRAAHSFKGLASMLGHARLAALLHDLESALDALRLGRTGWDATLRLALLEATSAAARGVREIHERGDDRVFAAEETREKLKRATERPASARGAGLELVELDERTKASLTEYEEHRLTDNLRQGRGIYAIAVSLDISDFDEKLRAVSERMNASGELLATLPSAEGSSRTRLAFRLLYAGAAEPSGIAKICPGAAVQRLDHRPAAPAAEAVETIRSAARTVRLPLERIDAVLAGAEEAGTAAERVLRSVSELARTLPPRRRYELRRDLADLGRAMRNLTQAAARTRLVPVHGLAVRLVRAVDRLLASSGKEADFRIEGETTEMDRVLLEELADPLLHVVRNAVDHAIEPPEERERLGKPRRGTIRFEARARGASVVLAVEDDGTGIGEAAVLARARELGWVGPGETPDRDRLFDLLFRPGFSTAARISEVSGRGVGLDVVQERLRAIRGEVRVFSTPGRGSRFELITPITLALFNALLVEEAGRLYALPMAGIRGASRLGPDERHLSVEGESLSVLPLAEALGVRRMTAVADRFALLLHDERAEARAIGVDRVLRDHPIVVRPLAEDVSQGTSFIGIAEVEGEGTVLVVDPGRLRAPGPTEGASRG